MLFSAAAAAQVTQYRTQEQPPAKSDSEKIVCQKEETVGSRLGTKKICLTVSEWKQRENIHREQTQKIQAGVCVPGGGCGEEPF